jgi:hypothetical protein
MKTLAATGRLIPVQFRKQSKMKGLLRVEMSTPDIAFLK